MLKKERSGVSLSNFENRISSVIKEKIKACGGHASMPALRGPSIDFQISSTGMGIETDKLPHYILEWEHFDKIITKANSLGGKMYRGDNLAQQSGSKLGYEISHDCMEGFVASELLGTEDGNAITRRSTYYSGILAWAEIVALHRSQGQGSFITVNEKYRDI